MRPPATLPILLVATALAATEYPAVTLTNGIGFELELQLPDPERGFYRGTRYDHAGMVSSLRYRGRRVFGPWREPHDPTAPDHGIGLAGEFDFHGPQQFDEVAPGAAFLKIGVGALRKPSAGARAEDYFFNHRFAWAEVPQWTVERSGLTVTMRQVAAAGDRGYAYACTVAVTADAPGLSISHALTNTGGSELVTEHYSHHFISFDGVAVGPGYHLTTPFEPRWEAVYNRTFWDMTRREGDTLHLTQPIGDGALYTAFAVEPIAAHNAFTLGGPDGIALRYRGDRPVARWALYAEASAICPEPFVEIRIAPGATETWVRRYELRLDE